MDFVTFGIAKKLKEKGFTCELPFAMYNEIGQFCLLTTSAPYNVCDSGYKCREYYDYEDFDEFDYIAPTISQVLKWLREEKNIYIISQPFASMDTTDKVVWGWHWKHNSDGEFIDVTYSDETSYISYEEASVAGINYALDNVI